MYALPLGNIVYMALEALGEITRIETAQIRRHPRGEMHAVGDVTYVQLVLEVPGPHVAQYIFRHLAVQPRHAVDLLREVAGQHRHREALVGIVGIGLAEVDELLPRNAQHVGIVRHILTHHRLGERVVTRGNGGMGRKERRRTHHLQSLREGQATLGDEVTDALYADERGVSLVAVINLLLDAHLGQRADTAHAQQQLLLQTVLPVAAVKVERDLTILLAVGLVIGIEQEQVGTAHLTLPYARRERAARERDLYRHPVAHLVAYGRDRQLEEVLRLVCGHLTALRRELLGEVSVTVEQTHGHHRHVLVRSLLQIVARQNAQTARIYLKRRVESVLHREVSYLGALGSGFLRHVGRKLRRHRVETGEELLVVLQLVDTLYRELVQQRDGIAVHGVPERGIDALEQVAGILRPAPPQIARDLLQRVQARRQTFLDHHAMPRRFV